MKNTTITVIMAATILIAGCGKKRAATNDSTPSIRTNYSLKYTYSNDIAGMQMTVNQCQVIAYATADTNNATNIVFTVSDIWKGANEATALGITNGTQFSFLSPASSGFAISNGDLLDGGIVLIPTVFYEKGIRQVLSPSEALQKRLILPVRAGQFDGMTIKEYKGKFGL
jgi:hypothetical protein